MIRPALPADLRRLVEIRDYSGADALSDPALVTDPALTQLIGAGAVSVWQEDGCVMGFAATDGETIHLLVDSAARGKGVGRELLAAARRMLRDAGHASARLTLAHGSTAERHYRAAGWTLVGHSSNGGSILQSP